MMQMMGIEGTYENGLLSASTSAKSTSEQKQLQKKKAIITVPKRRLPVPVSRAPVYLFFGGSECDDRKDE